MLLATVNGNARSDFQIDPTRTTEGLVHGLALGRGESSPPRSVATDSGQGFAATGRQAGEKPALGPGKRLPRESVKAAPGCLPVAVNPILSL